MKESIVVIQVVDRCRIELLLRVISGQVCQKRHRITSGQRFAPSIHQPRGILSSLSSPWLFAQ